MALNDGRGVPAFLHGTQTRSFCYVRDLVNGLILLSRSEQRYAHAAAERARVPIEFSALPEDDPRRRRPDITKARRILGWEPAVSLEEGLKETVAYFQSVIAAVV